MAEEKAASQPAAAAAPAASPAPSGGGGKSSMVLIGLLVLNMAFIGGVGFMLWSGRKKEQAEPRLDQVIKGEASAQKKEEAEQEVMGKVIPLETFIVNLAGTKGRKVLKVNMEIEVKGEAILQEIDSRKAQIRDFIIIILSSKNYDEISTREGKDNLRNEIKDTLNSFLTKGKIANVFFTEIIYN